MYPETLVLSAKRCVSSVPAAPRVCIVSDGVFSVTTSLAFFFVCFFFWHRAKGSARVLPFGKPEWHVSTTESDKETVKMVKEKWEEEEEEEVGGWEGGRGGMRNLNEWTKMGWWNHQTVKREDSFLFFLPWIIKWFQFLIFRSVIAQVTSLAWLPPSELRKCQFG